MTQKLDVLKTYRHFGSDDNQSDDPPLSFLGKRMANNNASRTLDGEANSNILPTNELEKLVNK